MKRSVLGFAAVLLVLPLAASAQIPSMPGSIEFSISGGTTVPFGDFNTVAEPGFGIGGHGSVYVMPNLALGASVVYNSYGVDEAFSTDASLSMWEFSANGKYMMMPGPIAPYAKASAGLYNAKMDAFGSSSSTNDFGFAGGVGVQLKVPTSNIGFYAEGMANSVMTEGSSTNFYTLRAGINWYMGIK